MHPLKTLSISSFLLLLLTLIPLTPSPIATGKTPSSVPACFFTLYLPLITYINTNTADVTADTVAITNTVQTTAASTPLPHSQPDFNGDGCADLALGVPAADLGSGARHGQVTVIYGGSSGLTAAGNQTWHRDGGYDADGNFLGDIQGDLDANDEFGSVIETADFNNDGYTDLAVGVPDSFDCGEIICGDVNIIFGSPNGLVAENNQYWSQDGGWTDPEGDGGGSFIGDIYGVPEDYNRFGNALAAGDFNNDTYTDLAIGVWGEDIGSLGSAGAVNVIYGTPTGLSSDGNLFMSQDEFTVENDTGSYTTLGDLLGGSEAGDTFGNAVTAGDVNGDGYDDLAIGAAGEAIGSLSNAGSFHIIFGSADGLTVINNEHWHSAAAYRDTDGNGTVDITLGTPEGAEEVGDYLATTLEMGDFDNDGYADLAVGVPREDLTIVTGNVAEDVDDVGVVQVFYGTNAGLRLDSQWIRQDGFRFGGDVSGSGPEQGDEFGEAIAVGDLNGDGYSDLIIGAPYEGFTSPGADVGSVTVLYGSADRLVPTGHQWLSQGLVINDFGTQMGSLVGEESAFNNFGFALTTADFNNDGHDDLVIGIPGYEATNGDKTGGISVMYGNTTGLQVDGNQFWSLDYAMDSYGNTLGDLYGTDGDDFELGGGLP